MSIASKIAILLVALGVGFTLWDYSNWHQAEYGRYGQGPEANQPTPTPQALANPVQITWAGLRISPPNGWQIIPVSQEPDFLLTLPLNQRVEVAKITGQDAAITVWLEPTEKGLTLAVDEEVQALPKLARERDYFNTDDVSVTVITWQQDQLTKQWAMLVYKGKLVVIEAQAATSVWNSFEPTFWDVYRSVVVF